MEPNVCNKLLANYSAFPKCNNIPNFDKVRVFLYNLFAVETGPVCLMLSRCYISNKPFDDPFLNDPADQIYWCSKNLPSVKHAAKACRQMRNKLVHREILPMQLLEKAILELCDFYRRMNQTSKILVIIIDRLYIISEIILGNEVKETSCCPLCGSLIQLDDLFIDDLFIMKERKDEVIDPFTLDKKEEIDKDKIATLKQWKLDGYMDKIKGRRII